MSRKKPQFTENIIPLLDHSQEYRSELFHMQLYFNKMLKILRNPRNSRKTIRNIQTNLQELVEDMLYHYQDAKKANILPKEFRYPN